MSLTEKVIDTSTLSQNRIRRFNGTDLFERIFTHIMWQAMEKGLVDGKYLFTDSTHLKASANYFQTCPLRTQCTPNQKAERLITRHIYQEAIDNANAVRLSEQGKKLYKRRAETVERSFADAKQHHRHRYVRYSGLFRVQMQCFLAAWAQNIKKIALVVWAFLCGLWFAIMCSSGAFAKKLGKILLQGYLKGK